MIKNLQQYFPMIRSREEVERTIAERADLQKIFGSWEIEQKEEFLDFCTGVKGIKFLYDFMFKEILNPEIAPDRINRLLSLLLGQNIKVLHVLPNDSTRIADENALLVTDLVVELENGSIANVEIQKIGYCFPGQRGACYSADLLLRQYKRVRGRNKTFNYKDIKDVYTIVFFEKSPREFREFPEEYVHYFQQRSNTGLELELLQKYVFVPLDIFREKLQDKSIENELDAWLAFLGIDDPEIVAAIIERYPDFKPMYEYAYDICRNIEGVMNMFSEELRELDRNTTQYMIDELQELVDRKKEELQITKEELQTIEGKLQTAKDKLQTTEDKLQITEEELQQTQSQLIQKESRINELLFEIARLKGEM